MSWLRPKRKERLQSPRGSQPRIHSALRYEAGHPLSEREIQVLHHASYGLTNKEIGLLLYVSEETVKTHMKHIIARLGVQNRTAAVRAAFEQGYLEITSRTN